MQRFVAYYRVSTERQGASGLGLDAQQGAVRRHVGQHGGQLLAEFREVESGKTNSRPELARALDACKALGATLLIARLDRLARNLYVVASLLESGVDFLAVDMPTANKLTIHLMAAIAEHERDQISRNTKAALAEAKKRGKILGNPRLHAARIAACEANALKAGSFANTLWARVVDAGWSDLPLRRIAQLLNNSGARTQRGCEWTATGIRNVKIRANSSNRHLGDTRRK